MQLRVVLVVALGGALGACARWLVDQSAPVEPGGFPWTTFAINVSGSLLLACLPAVRVVRRHPLLAPALGTGVLGGFTTLSAYSEQSRALLAAGHEALALTYLLGTLCSCLLVVAAVDRLLPRRVREDFAGQEGDL